MVLSTASGRDRSAPVALWLLPVSDVGGVTRHVLDVARTGLPGWRLEIVLPPGPVATQLLDHQVAGVAGVTGVTVAPVGPEHGLRRSLAAYRSVLTRVRPTLVHTHLAYADVVAAIGTPRRYADGARPALVSTEHGIAGDELTYHRTRARAALRARLHQARLRRTDAVIAVSDATLAAMRSAWHLGPGTPAYVVRNGVDALATSTPIPGGRHRGLHVVSLSRLAPEKRLDDLLAAFAVLARERPDARLTMAGGGELDARLRARAAELGVADRVSLPGVVDAADLLAGADVLAQLSAWENCSYALLDAVVRGVGVVASRVGGNPELLPNRCLVPPGDPAEVARALLVQGTRREARPTLPARWPSVAMMSRQLVEVYAGVPGAAGETPPSLRTAATGGRATAIRTPARAPASLP